VDKISLYYIGVDEELDDEIHALAKACDGVWKALVYSHTSKIRRIDFTFTNEDDEMGFVDEVLDLRRGITFQQGEQCTECFQWVDRCECEKGDCGCVNGECQCGRI